VVPILERLVESTESTGALDRAQNLLLRAVVSRVGDSKKRGAALLGVTTPTYQRRLEALETDREKAEPTSVGMASGLARTAEAFRT
jgi:hypothetical protein